MIQLQKPIICSSFFISALLSIFLSILGNTAFAQQQFATYKSERYDIQFEYPVNWTLKEKTSRVDDGGEITVRSPNLRAIFGFDIVETSDLFGTSDIEDASKIMIPLLESSLFRFDVQTIEEPHLSTIDNKTAATVVISAVERYNDNPLKIKDQQWLVIIDNIAYLISYIDSPPTDFDSPSHTHIRDQFIKSIKFL